MDATAKDLAQDSRITGLEDKVMRLTVRVSNLEANANKPLPRPKSVFEELFDRFWRK